MHLTTGLVLAPYIYTYINIYNMVEWCNVTYTYSTVIASFNSFSLIMNQTLPSLCTYWAVVDVSVLTLLLLLLQSLCFPEKTFSKSSGWFFSFWTFTALWFYFINLALCRPKVLLVIKALFFFSYSLYLIDCPLLFCHNILKPILSSSEILLVLHFNILHYLQISLWPSFWFIRE